MKTVSVCGQINSEEEIEFMQFRDYQLFNSSDVRYIHDFNNGRIFPKEALNDANRGRISYIRDDPEQNESSDRCGCRH